MSFFNKTLQFTTTLTPEEVRCIIIAMEEKPKIRTSILTHSSDEVTFRVERMEPTKFEYALFVVIDGSVRHTEQGKWEVSLSVGYGAFAMTVLFICPTAGLGGIGLIVSSLVNPTADCGAIFGAGILFLIGSALVVNWAYADRKEIEALVVSKLQRP